MPFLDRTDLWLSMEFDKSPSSGSSSEHKESLDDEDDDIALLLLESLTQIIHHGDDAVKGSHGGSIPGRKTNAPRDFEAALDRLKHNYFGTRENAHLRSY
jgi:hypothetical protein